MRFSPWFFGVLVFGYTEFFRAFGLFVAALCLVFDGEGGGGREGGNEGPREEEGDGCTAAVRL